MKCLNLIVEEGGYVISFSPLIAQQHGNVGSIDGAFGKAGRFRARFPPGTSVKVRCTWFIICFLPVVHDSHDNHDSHDSCGSVQRIKYRGYSILFYCTGW